MAPKFIKVVGFSSEDPKQPASNLINSKGTWKCKENGEKQAWVILQTDSLINISHVDIGNLCSAFVEVQVGRVGMDQDKFSVLLPSSSFMGPEESKSLVNETRVRMFSSDKLNQSALKEKWNLIKIICSQPFNKHTKYGISFIALSAVDETITKLQHKTTEQPKKLGAFSIKSADEDDFSIGTYFQKKKDPAPTASPSADRASASAELRADRTLASLALQSSAKEEKKLLDLKAKYKKSTEKKKHERGSRDIPRRDMLPGETDFVPDDKKEKGEEEKKHRQKRDEEKESSKNKHEGSSKDKHKGRDEREKTNSKDKHHQISDESKNKDKRNSYDGSRSNERKRSRSRDKDAKSKDKERKNSGDAKRKERHSSGDAKRRERHGSDETKKTSSNNAKSQESKAKKYAPFNKLMEGVTFVISGFQNPLRGDIRSQACKMGAKYKADWDGSCTHLICAFANTPKYNQVKGKGKIVTKDWIQESYNKKTKLNWKKFSLTKKADEESEEEIYEGEEPVPVQTVQSSSSTHQNSRVSTPNAGDMDEDTDDEIERIMNANKVFTEDSNGATNASTENINGGNKASNGVKTSESRNGSSMKSDDGYNMDEDTDDEIERVQRKLDQESGKHRHKKSRDISDEELTPSKRVKRETPKKKAKDKNERNGGKSPEAAYEIETDDENSDDAYSAQTDVEDDNLEDLKERLNKLPTSKYPQIFKGKCFFLKSLDKDESNLLERYITCYGGDVSMYNSQSVDYILTKSASQSDIRDAKSVNSRVQVLKPAWVFKCCDKQERVSTEKYRC